jgi:hypothetical protein
MHGPALAWTQRRTIGRRARSRALENRLSWHRTSWRRTHAGSRGRSGGACRRGWPQGRFIYRTRARLRNDHSRRRRCRLHRRARGDWPGSYGRWLCRRRCGPRRRRGRAVRRKWWSSGWYCRSRRHWSRGRSRLRRSRRWSSKAWPRCRSRHNKLGRRHRRRSGCLRGRHGRCWRSSRGRRSWRRCRYRWSLHGRGRLLLADDGF